MSAAFNPELCAVQLTSLLRRMDELSNELMILTNRCELTQDRLAADQAEKVREQIKHAATIIGAVKGEKP